MIIIMATNMMSPDHDDHSNDRVRRHVCSKGAHAGCGCHSNQHGTARFAKTTNAWNLGIMKQRIGLKDMTA